LAVAGPLREAELRDHPGLDPGDILLARRGCKRAALGGERSHLAPEGGERLPRRAGADLPGEAKRRTVVQAHEERPEVRAAPARARVSADDELGLAARL